MTSFFKEGCSFNSFIITISIRITSNQIRRSILKDFFSLTKKIFNILYSKITSSNSLGLFNRSYIISLRANTVKSEYIKCGKSFIGSNIHHLRTTILRQRRNNTISLFLIFEFLFGFLNNFFI
jgi:hypothetical protein